MSHLSLGLYPVKMAALFRSLSRFNNSKCNSTTARFVSSSTMSDRKVLTETVGKVLLIGINRPEKRNCVNQETAALLYEAFTQFENNDNLRVAVLHGKGGNFCAGYDLSELSTFEGVNVPSLDYDKAGKGRGPMGPSRMFFSKPVIAAVSGYAVAGGIELALMCDMRVAEKGSTFGVFCRRFGVPLLDGGTARLPQLIGLSRALDMILTGRGVGADEAFQMGLANRVVPNGTALDEAIRLAQTIAEFPQQCMISDRRSAFYSCFEATSLEDALKFENDNGVDVIQKESVGGATRFVQGAGRGGTFDNLNKKSNL